MRIIARRMCGNSIEGVSQAGPPSAAMGHNESSAAIMDVLEIAPATGVTVRDAAETLASLWIMGRRVEYKNKGDGVHVDWGGSYCCTHRPRTYS